MAKEVSAIIRAAQRKCEAAVAAIQAEARLEVQMVMRFYERYPGGRKQRRSFFINSDDEE